MSNPYTYKTATIAHTATVNKVLSTLGGVTQNPDFEPFGQPSSLPPAAYTDKPLLMNYWLGQNSAGTGKIQIALDKLEVISCNPAGSGTVGVASAGPALTSVDVNNYWENATYTNGFNSASVYYNGVLYVRGLYDDTAFKECYGILATPIPFGSSGTLSPSPIGAAAPVGFCNSFCPSTGIDGVSWGIVTWAGKTQIIIGSRLNGSMILSDLSGNITDVSGVWPGVDTVNTTEEYLINTDGTYNYFVSTGPGETSGTLYAVKTNAATGALVTAAKLTFANGEKVLWGYANPLGFTFFLNDGTASIVQLAMNCTSYERIQFSTLPASSDPTSYQIGGFGPTGANTDAPNWADSGPALYDPASGKIVVCGAGTGQFSAVLIG